MSSPNQSHSPSPSLGTQVATPYYHFPNEVVMTHTIKDLRDTNNRQYVNQYIILHKIGGGQHGQVFKAFDVKDNMEVAIKACRRKNPKLDNMARLRQNNPNARPTKDKNVIAEAERKIRQEIAIMKKCNHGQIVRLLEVMDDQRHDKILLVMEYMGGGDVKWRDTHTNRPLLRVDQARRICRDVTLGLEYLHYQGIIHRDIKPANLLWTADRKNVKIADFGVSAFSYTQRLDALKKSGASAKDMMSATTDDDRALFNEAEIAANAGTLYFLAPEVVVWSPDPPGLEGDATMLGEAAMRTTDGVGEVVHVPRKRMPVTRAIDIWALGVTLYCLLFASLPWTAKLPFDMYKIINTQDFTVADTMGRDEIPTGGRKHDPDDQTEGGIVINLLNRMLEKDCEKRITLAEIKRLPWILRDIENKDEWLRETAPDKTAVVEVSADETNDAMVNVKFRWRERITQVIRGIRHPRQNLAASHTLLKSPSVVPIIPPLPTPKPSLPPSATGSLRSVKRTSSQSGRGAHLFAQRRTPPTSHQSVGDLSRTSTWCPTRRTSLKLQMADLSREIVRREARSPKPRRGSESLLVPPGPYHSASSTPSPSPTIGYTSDGFISEREEGTSHVRRKLRSRLSVSLQHLRRWTSSASGGRSPSGIDHNHQRQNSQEQKLRKESREKVKAALKGKGRVKNAEQVMPMPTPLPLILTRRSADEFNLQRPPDVSSNTIANIIRAASWGEDAEQYDRQHVDCDILNSDGDIEVDRDELATLGGGGIPWSSPTQSRRSTSGSVEDWISHNSPDLLQVPSGCPNGLPAEFSLPLLQPQPERLLDQLELPPRPDPAMQETAGPSRLRNPQRRHRQSPLAPRGAFRVGALRHLSVFGSTDQMPRSDSRGEYIHGAGTSQISFSDDEEDADNDCSSDEEPRLEIRRKGTEILARSSSGRRPEKSPHREVAVS